MTYRKSAELLLPIADRLAAISQDLGLHDVDARRVGLTNCRAATGWAVMTLNVLSAGEEGRLDEPALRSLFGVPEGPLQTAAEVMEKYTRVGYVTMFQFQVEHMLASLLGALGELRPRGFWNIAKRLLDSVSIDDAAHKLDVLYVPAMIRNSLHSNGIHHGQDTTTAIGQTTYEFRVGQRVSCAGWPHVANVLAAVVEILNEILRCPEVGAIQGDIPDAYAQEMAGQQSS